MANHLKLPGLSSTKENLISSQSDVDIAAALPLYDVAVAKTIEFLADTRYIMSPSLRLLTYPHCILVSFGRENYGEYARSLKRFSFIAIQYLRWLWTFLGISNSGITVFSSDLLETVVTTTKSQNI